MREIYLDYAATHPMTDEAQAAYLHAAREVGNAASVHRAGQRARERLEEGRAAFAQAIGVHPLTIIANGGGTEGDNHVLMGVMAGYPGDHLITTLTEHSAVLAPARALLERGHDVTFLSPDRHGRITVQQIEDALRPNTRLVSLHHANNETGAVQDVAGGARLTRARGVLLHTDAVQSPGVLEVAPESWGVDFATFSAHKWGGPKGVGFLYVRRGLDLRAVTLGGGQEKGVRPGTQNVAGIYAAGVTALTAVQAQPSTHAHLTRVKAAFLEELAGVPDLSFNHPPEGGSPKVVNVTAHGSDGEALLMNLDMLGVYASAGSACSAGTMQPSHVLSALGLSDQDARSSLRFSFGNATSTDDAREAARALTRAVQFSR